MTQTMFFSQQGSETYFLDSDDHFECNSSNNKFEAEIFNSISVCLDVNCEPKMVPYNLVDKLYYDIRIVDCPKDTDKLLKTIKENYVKLSDFFRTSHDPEANILKKFFKRHNDCSRSKDATINNLGASDLYNLLLLFDKY